MSGKYIDSTGVTYLWGKVKERVQANPTDTGTADLTKLKVGTTTYNIPSGGGVFDLTPYLNFETMSIGTEGFNALKDYITNNNCPIVAINLNGDTGYYTISACSTGVVLCYYVEPAGAGTATVGLTINSDGSIVMTDNKNYIVEANPTETGTTTLTKLKVGTTTYNIPRDVIDTELSETSENPVQNKSVTTAITSLRERKYDQNNFQLRDGDYTTYQKDLSRIYRTEFDENGAKTNVSYRIPVVKAGGSMGAGWKPFEGIKLDGQDYVFWLNNYKFGTNEEYKHTSSNFDYAEIQDLMYNGFRYRTQTIIDLDKLGFSSGRETLTDEIITMIKNGSNIVIIHKGVTYRDYTEDADYYNFTSIDYTNHPNEYWVKLTLRIGKNDKSLLLFNGNGHYFVEADSSTAAYHYLDKLKVGNVNYMVSEVKANPSETGNTDLKSINIRGIIYNIPSGGTNVEANPTETGTTTLTKLKVGTTTYNIPSGGGSGSGVSVFDLTPYFDGAESIGTEGYNALKDYITNNNCPMVRLDLGGEIYCFNVAVYTENAFMCSLAMVDNGVTALQLNINNNGGVAISQAQMNQIEGMVEQGTMNLKGLKIGIMSYNIPRLETYTLNINNNTGKSVPLKILTYETDTDGICRLRVHDGNYGPGHSDHTLVIGFVYKQMPIKYSGCVNLFTTNDGTFAILVDNAEYSV